MAPTAFLSPDVIAAPANAARSLKPEGYFADSDYFRVRKEYVAEVIYQPEDKVRRAGLTETLIEELGGILLEAFGRTWKDAETFLGGDHFTKVAISVDYLVVIRKDGRPVAYGAGSFLSPTLFYLNSLMVRPKYQRVGLGFFASALLWRYADEHASNRGQVEPTAVCRTHNRNVASGFLRLLRESDISTELDRTSAVRTIFKRTASLLGCGYDEATGISRNVYPDELPAGTKTVESRINRAFDELGPKDGLYIAGKLNQGFLSDLLREHVTELVTEPEREWQLAVA